MDPLDAYASVVEAIYGDGAHELVSKLSETKKQKRQAQVALGGNVLGLTAGTAALVTAAKNPALRPALASAEHAGPVTSRAMRYIKTPRGRGRLVLAGAAGATGLQAANLAGDVAGNIVLRREVKKSSPDSADLHAPGSNKVYLNKGTLTLMAAEKAAPHVKTGAKKTADITVKGVKAGTPVIVDTGRKINDKVRKNDAPRDVVWEGEFAKFDTDKRQVFGWASIVEVDGQPVVDLQGDYITPDEIEKAAYTYVTKSRKGGDMHRRDGAEPVHVSDMIESFMVTPEKKKAMGLPDSIPTGWWVGFQVNDEDTWDLVKKNKRTGFSIHGKGKRKAVGE